MFALSRRAVLLTGLTGIGTLALGVGVVALWPGVPATPARPLLALSPAQYATLRALADRVCPGGGSGGLPAASALNVAETLDALLAISEPGVVEELGMALTLLENGLAGALLERSRFRPFTALAPEDQDAVIIAWRLHRMPLLRAAIKGLSGLCASVYWGNPITHAACGYPGPPAGLVLVTEAG